jgi:transcription antitermination factor NusG
MLGESFLNSTDLGAGSSSSLLTPLNTSIEGGLPQWFAAYVQTRHEKTVAEQLEERCVERFLPVYEATHRWKNGRHKVQLPLFPSYVFVHISPWERLRVLQVPGVSYIVGSHGIPTPIALQDIEQLRNALRGGVVAQPFPYLTVGARVEIRNGPLQGLVGILKRWRGQFRVVISVDLIMQSIAVEVDVSDVVPVRSTVRIQA